MAGSVLVYDVWCLNPFSALPSWPNVPGCRPCKSNAWHLEETWNMDFKHGQFQSKQWKMMKNERHLRAKMIHLKERPERNLTDLTVDESRNWWIMLALSSPANTVHGSMDPRLADVQMNLTRQQSPCEWLRMTSKSLICGVLYGYFCWTVAWDWPAVQMAIETDLNTRYLHGKTNGPTECTFIMLNKYFLRWLCRLPFGLGIVVTGIWWNMGWNRSQRARNRMPKKHGCFVLFCHRVSSDAARSCSFSWGISLPPME